MVDNQHKKITGYRDLQQDEIDLMNDVKDTEIDVAGMWKTVVDAASNPEIAVTLDMRWANIAKTHLQEGFSALIRAIAKPKDPFDRGEISHPKDAPPDVDNDAADDLNNLVND